MRISRRAIALTCALTATTIHAQGSGPQAGAPVQPTPPNPRVDALRYKTYLEQIGVTYPPPMPPASATKADALR